MPSPSRRRFLSGSVLTIASLTGYVEADSQGSVPPDRPSVGPDEYDDALGPVPPADAIETPYQIVVTQAVDVPDESELPAMTRMPVERFELEPSTIETVCHAYPTDYQAQLGVVVGSFDRFSADEIPSTSGNEPRTPDEATGDAGTGTGDAGTGTGDAGVSTGEEWTVVDDGEVAVASTDGIFLFAGGEDAEQRVGVVRTMAATATGDHDRFVETAADAATAFDVLDDEPTVLFVPDPATSGVSASADDRLRSLAAGFEKHPGRLSGTSENEYYLFPTPDATLDREAVLSIVDDVSTGIVGDATIRTTDDFVHATVVVDAPPERDREAAPSARVETTYDAEAAELTIEHVGGEPIPTADLELWVDGELADSQPEASLQRFESGDTLTVGMDAVGTVALRWFDESENVFYPYVNETIGRDAFEFEHDFEAGTVTVRYVGSHDVDASKLTAKYRRDDGSVRQLDGKLGDDNDVLSNGDAFTVEDVTVGDYIEIDVTTPTVPGMTHQSVAYYNASPPQIYVHEEPERGTVLEYYGETDRDPEAFRVLVDGELAATQPADVVDSLPPRTTVELGEFPLGSELTIEWVRPDDPVEVTKHVVTPQVDISMTYDMDTGTGTVEHEDGIALDASKLVLRVDGDAAAGQPTDAFDEFAPGDSFSVDVPPFAIVSLVWVHGSTEDRLSNAVTGRNALQAIYDPDAESLEFVYVGDEPAAPSRLELNRMSASNEPSDMQSVFAGEYDELTRGDSVEVDAEVGDRFMLLVRVENDEAQRVQPVLHVATEPRDTFSFVNEDGTVTLEYRDTVIRDAAEFTVFVDGERTDRQPADVYDVLEPGASMDLGEFDVGTELRVDWTVPENSSTVTEHVVSPDVSFDVSYDAPAETLTVKHAGGDTLQASELSLIAPPGIDTPVDWSGSGTVSEGDSATFEAVERPEQVLIRYRDVHLLLRESVVASDDESDSGGDGGTDSGGDGGTDSGGDGGTDSGGDGGTDSGGDGGSGSDSPDGVVRQFTR